MFKSKTIRWPRHVAGTEEITSVGNLRKETIWKT
jgi:hypothetical protein